MGKKKKVTHNHHNNDKLIRNNHSPKVKVSNNFLPHTGNQKISFDFTYSSWMKSVKVGDFTNFLHNNDEYASKIFNVIHFLFPKIQEDAEKVIKNGGRISHTHIVSDKKISLIKKIANKTHGREFEEVLKKQWWQLGFTNATRVIAIYDDTKNVLYPIFIDFHHLIHADENYNQKDFSTYDFCPVEKYDKSYSMIG